MTKKIILKIIAFISMVTLFVFCSDNTLTSEKVIAEVNNKPIYTDDFLKNYEFAFANLKLGNTSYERKASYLNFLINEKLLAAEGYKHGVNQYPEFIYEKELISKELFIEQLIDTEIKSNIKILDSEIKEAISKSKVSFKIEYWGERNESNLSYLKSEFENKGFENTVKVLIEQNKEISISDNYVKTDYLTWSDVSPDIFEIIRNLKVNEISEPFYKEGIYYFYRVVDIRRTSITEKEFLDKSPTFRKIIYNQKLQQAIVSFVDALLTKKNIRTKKKTFNVFKETVKEWLMDSVYCKKSFSEYMELNSDIESVNNLNRISNEIIVSSNSKNFTVKELLQLFCFNRINADSKTIWGLKNELAELIAISIRDYYLFEYAKEKYSTLNPKFAHELSKWEDKWAYQIYRENYLNNTIIPEFIDSLKNEYQVNINNKVLKSLKVVDSKKSRSMTVHLFRGGTKRMVEPIVDAEWATL